jgi:hypothetical protein
MSHFHFAEIAAKFLRSLLISAIFSVSNLLLTILAGMWALQALLVCQLSMWATASPGLPGEFDLQAYMYVCFVHVCTVMRTGKYVHTSHILNNSKEQSFLENYWFLPNLLEPEISLPYEQETPCRPSEPHKFMSSHLIFLGSILIFHSHTYTYWCPFFIFLHGNLIRIFSSCVPHVPPISSSLI